VRHDSSRKIASECRSKANVVPALRTGLSDIAKSAFASPVEAIEYASEKLLGIIAP